MNNEALTALKESIAHWERNATGKFDGMGPEHCNLCQLFIGDRCEGCPVFESTERPFCIDTPYEALDVLFDEIEFSIGSETSPDFKALAQDELAFLKSLLPEGET